MLISVALGLCSSDCDLRQFSQSCFVWGMSGWFEVGSARPIINEWVTRDKPFFQRMPLQRWKCVGADDQTKPSKSSDLKWQTTSVDILIEISSLLANLGHLPVFWQSSAQMFRFFPWFLLQVPRSRAETSEVQDGKFKLWIVQVVYEKIKIPTENPISLDL